MLGSTGQMKALRRGLIGGAGAAQLQEPESWTQVQRLTQKVPDPERSQPDRRESEAYVSVMAALGLLD